MNICCCDCSWCKMWLYLLLILHTYELHFFVLDLLKRKHIENVFVDPKNIQNHHLTFDRNFQIKYLIINNKDTSRIRPWAVTTNLLNWNVLWHICTAFWKWRCSAHPTMSQLKLNHFFFVKNKVKYQFFGSIIIK